MSLRLLVVSKLRKSSMEEQCLTELLVSENYLYVWRIHLQTTLKTILIRTGLRGEKLMASTNGRTWEAPLAPLYASVVGMWLWCFLVPSLSYFFPSASIACFNSSSAKGLQSVQVWKGVFGLRVKWFFNQRGKKAGDGVYPIEFNQWSVISKWRQSLWQGSAQLI